MKNSKIIKKEEEKTLTIKGKQLKIKRKIIPFLKSQNEIKEDCFAFSQGKCSALNELYCKNKECRFYKNKSEYIEEIKIEEEK